MGLNILTLGSSKTYTNLVALGISSVVVDDTAKSITFILASDGSRHTIHFDQPSDGQDGVSVTDIDVNKNNQIVCTMSDGTIINAGEIKIDSSSLELDNYYTKKDSDELYISKTDFATSDDIEKLF